jgi:hypothetical protein
VVKVRSGGCFGFRRGNKLKKLNYSGEWRDNHFSRPGNWAEFLLVELEQRSQPALAGTILIDW